MAKILGIDLGTTNSVAAVIDAGEATVVENAEGNRITPSVVAVNVRSERQAVTNPENTIFSVKRLMGRRYDEPIVQDAAKRLPYQVVSGDNGDAHVEMSGQSYAPPQISSMILQKIRQAVITVPAYFNDSQRQATKDAGTIAGLDVLRSTNGDTFLGGDDFDDAILNETGIDLTQDRMALQRLRDAAERAKIELSTISDAGIGAGSIDDVILVGGMSRMPSVQAKVQQIFGREPSRSSDSQPSVDIHVLQGERPMSNDNKTIGRFMLDGILPAPRGMPQIDVTFDIDSNGILSVSAQDKGTGKEQRIVIQTSSGLSQEDIERMMSDAEANEAADRERRAGVETRNQADSLAYSAERLLTEHAETLPADLKAEADAKLESLRTAIAANNVAQMQTAINELNEALQRVGQAVYTQPGAGGPGDAGGAGDAPPGSDDTVEGEFREV
ncbi:Chaperone protein DnaK [Geodia barretti]|uniref:Chaperone protein DnaK n=1 Tax=Geodia barretti TaxID=519541 RepID=A0AA35R248_GEOBA|nr:Chaperone protein DnaK [Geodia barretti]